MIRYCVHKSRAEDYIVYCVNNSRAEDYIEPDESSPQSHILLR
jgi:hypothetical protein